MKDLDVLRQAQLLLGQYGFDEEQAAVGKAIRIISTTAKRLGAEAEAPLGGPVGSQGARLAALREKAGLTRGQVAQLCGVMLSTVRAHENSDDAISPEAADAYAGVFGTTRHIILFGRP